MADWKDHVRVATTTNITLSGLQTIDGVSLAAGDSVLVKDQTTASQNGIYTVASGAWPRRGDANTAALLAPEHAVRVSEGSLYAHTAWAMTTQGSITVGTTALSYTLLPNASLDWKDHVRVATTTNITLSGLQTVDGVLLAAGDSVLVKDQATPSQNGIYLAASATWVRRKDANIAALLAPDHAVRVSEGTLNKHTCWYLATQGVIVVGTTGLTYAPIAHVDVRATSSVSGPGFALRTNLATGGMSIASTNSRTSPFHGVSLAPASAGQPIAVRVAGPIDPTVFNLGNGVACAVGTRADGSLCRATDPNLASAGNWVGSCDMYGTVTVAPFRRDENNVLDFGADPSASSSSQTAFEQAIAKTEQGDLVKIPRGRYVLTATLDLEALTGRPQPGITLRGAGCGVAGVGSELYFSNSNGDGIRAITDPTTNSHGFVTIEDLLLTQTNKSNRLWQSEAGASGLRGGAAIGAIGGGFLRIFRCATNGVWRFGVAFDGTEELVIDGWLSGHNRNDPADPDLVYGERDDDFSVGIWIAGGSRGMSVPDASNVWFITHANHNGPSFGYLVETGSSNVIEQSLVNIVADNAKHTRSAFAVLNGASYTRFKDCYSEGASSAGAFFYWVGGTNNVTITGGVYSGHQPFARLGTVTQPFIPGGAYGYAYGLRIEDALLSCDWIIGSQYITGVHFSLNNMLSGAITTTRAGDLYDNGYPGMTHGLIANFGQKGGYSQSSGGPMVGDHSWAMKTWDRAIHADTIGVYTFRTYGARSNPYYAKSFNTDQVRSANGYMHGRSQERESTSVAQSAPDQAAGALAVAQRAHGHLTIEVHAMAAADESKGGCWRIRQRVYRPSGGNVLLVGSPTVEVSEMDAGFTAPVIAADTATQTVRAMLRSRSDGATYYSVVTTYEDVRP